MLSAWRDIGTLAVNGAYERLWSDFMDAQIELNP